MSVRRKRDGKHTPDKQTEHTYPTSRIVRWQKQAAFDPTGVLRGSTSLSRVSCSGSSTHCTPSQFTMTATDRSQVALTVRYCNRASGFGTER